MLNWLEQRDSVDKSLLSWQEGVMPIAKTMIMVLMIARIERKRRKERIKENRIENVDEIEIVVENVEMMIMIRQMKREEGERNGGGIRIENRGVEVRVVRDHVAVTLALLQTTAMIVEEDGKEENATMRKVIRKRTKMHQDPRVLVGKSVAYLHAKSCESNIIKQFQTTSRRPGNQYSSSFSRPWPFGPLQIRDPFSFELQPRQVHQRLALARARPSSSK